LRTSKNALHTTLKKMAILINGDELNAGVR
jgi:hypothetical protein